MSRLEAMRRGRQIRQRYRDAGKPFEQSEFEAALLAECQDLKQELLQGLVHSVAKSIDDQSTSEDRPDQGELFTLQGEYKLGDGRRVAKERCRIEHMRAAVALSDQNRDLVVAANIAIHEELERLTPYWKKNMTKAQAVAAYQKAQPASA